MNKQLIINVLNKKNIEINKEIFLEIRDQAIFEGKKLRKEIDEFTKGYTDEKIDFKEDRNLKYFINNIYFKENKLSRVSRKAIEEIAEETGENIFNAINKYRELANKVDRLNKLGKMIKNIEVEKYGDKWVKPTVNLSFNYNSGGYIYNIDQLLRFSREETMLIFNCHSVQMETAEEVMEVIKDLVEYKYNLVFAIGNTIYYTYENTNYLFNRKYKEKIKHKYDVEEEYKEKITEEYKEKMHKDYVLKNNYYTIEGNIEEFIGKYEEIIDYFIEDNKKLYFYMYDFYCPLEYSVAGYIEVARLIRDCLLELQKKGVDKSKLIKEEERQAWNLDYLTEVGECRTLFVA